MKKKKPKKKVYKKYNYLILGLALSLIAFYSLIHLGVFAKGSFFSSDIDGQTVPKIKKGLELEKVETEITPAANETAAKASQEEDKPQPKPSAKPAAPKPAGYIAPGLVAEQPVAYKKDEKARRVCLRNHDKPEKSKQGKSAHIDMECCLDPDEIPNPFCYYPPEKYGGLLNRYKTEKKNIFIDKATKKKK